LLRALNRAPGTREAAPSSQRHEDDLRLHSGVRGTSETRVVELFGQGLDAQPDLVVIKTVHGRLLPEATDTGHPSYWLS
jgi:hypothetical protein